MAAAPAARTDVNSVRLAYRIVAGLFPLACILAFFLAGAGAFGATTSYSAHRAIGSLVLALALLALVLAIVSRLDSQTTLLALALFVLALVQFALARIGGVPWLEALHPVNGLLVLGLGLFLGHRAWAKSSRRPAPAA